MASVIGSLLRGHPARCSHGEQLRDLLHVQDAADAFAALLDSDVRGPVNVASGQPVALKDVARRIAEQIGGPAWIELGAVPAPEADPPLLIADVRRLRYKVGWSPGTTWRTDCRKPSPGGGRLSHLNPGPVTVSLPACRGESPRGVERLFQSAFAPGTGRREVRNVPQEGFWDWRASAWLPEACCASGPSLRR